MQYVRAEAYSAIELLQHRSVARPSRLHEEVGVSGPDRSHYVARSGPNTAPPAQKPAVTVASSILREEKV